MQSQSFNRTQIYLTVGQQNALAEMAKSRHSTSSALIREAVDAYLRSHQPASKLARRAAASGQWAANPDAPSVRDLRGEERSF